MAFEKSARDLKARHRHPKREHHGSERGLVEEVSTLLISKSTNVF
jgi:hypothetical protein